LQPNGFNGNGKPESRKLSRKNGRKKAKGAAQGGGGMASMGTISI